MPDAVLAWLAPLSAAIFSRPVAGRGGAAANAERPAPRVSVIVPAHNGAATLPATLASLRRQRMRDWEALVVDDGSVDGSFEVAERWARRDPRIRPLRREQGGAAAARNTGLAHARGDWISFLDCDDWLSPSAFTGLLAFAQAQPDAGVVAGQTVVISPDGRRRAFPPPHFSSAFDTFCCEGMPIHGALTRREHIEAVGGFDAALRTGEDSDLWQRLARCGVGFAKCDARVAFYRNRPGSLSKNMRQVASDGLIVIRRGHGPDPRVPAPAPAYANGAPANALPSREIYFTLWCAAREIAAGGDGLSIMALLGGVPCPGFEPRSLAELMAGGMGEMASGTPERLAPRWAEFEPKLRGIFAAARADEVATGLAMATLKARLNGGRPGEPDVLQLDRPQIAWAGEGPPLAIQVRLGDRTLGAVATPALGAMSRASLAEAVASQAARLPLTPTLKAARAWRSAVFWAATLSSLGRTAARALPRVHTAAELRIVGRAAVRRALAAGLKRQVAAAILKGSAGDEPCTHSLEVARLAHAADAEAGALSARPAPEPARPSVSPIPAAPAATEVPILMYHRVADAGPEGLRRYRLTPAQFEAQLAALRKAGCRSVTPEELEQFLRFEARLPARSVMLTFDDGYVDFAESAWPLLQRYGFGATLFAVTAKVGQRSDWDADHGDPAPLLDWDGLRALAAQGVAIESHSATHPALSALAPGEIYGEAFRSAAAIRQVTGRRPRTICYPYGAYDSRVERAFEEAGYRLGMTTASGWCGLGASPYSLPRVEVSGLDDLESFQRKLRLA